MTTKKNSKSQAIKPDEKEPETSDAGEIKDDYNFEPNVILEADSVLMGAHRKAKWNIRAGGYFENQKWVTDPDLPFVFRFSDGKNTISPAIETVYAFYKWIRQNRKEIAIYLKDERKKTIITGNFDDDDD